MSLFSTCIITTSSEQRAKVYRDLIQHRKDHGIYPVELDFRVYSDPDGVKAGSGGATLLALNTYLDELDPQSHSSTALKSKKVLIIHSGGPADTLPVYKPEGMSFTPVPVDSSSIYSPVLLDLQLNFFLKYPWRQSEIVIAPGDVFLDCDPTQLTESRGDIHGFAISAVYDRGALHGVFTFDSYMHAVTGYVQKASVAFLKEHAAIEGTDQCAVDTGIISLSGSYIAKLLQFCNHTIHGKRIIDLLNEGSLSFNLYLELLTVSLRGITIEEYRKKVISLTKNTDYFLDLLYETFGSFTLTATLIKHAQFHHPDTMKRYLDMCIDLQLRPVDLWYAPSYSELGVKHTASWIVYNSHSTRTPLRKGNPVLVESVRNATFENPLGNNIFTGIIQWETNATIPDGLCIDRRSIGKNNIFLVYHIDDSFDTIETIDKITFCGVPLKQWLEQRSLTLDDIGVVPTACHMCDALLFCSNGSEDFLCGYWNPPMGSQWAETFRKNSRFSLNSASSVELALVRDEERKKIRATLLKKQISNGQGWVSISSRDFQSAFASDNHRTALEKVCRETGDTLVKAYRKRLLDTVGSGSDISVPVGFLEHDYSNDLTNTPFALERDRCVVVKCPVRLDIAGGWTDMPPFTLRHGGTVVNFALNCNGTEPIQVFCKRSKENCIRLISIDKGVAFSINDFSDFRNVPFECEIASAALRSAGFSQEKHASLPALLKKLGGGIEITTFCGVPQGSGLGTSSILFAATLSALQGLFGKELTHEDLVSSIIALEQLFRIGSGWQDLLGGLYGGIKLLKSKQGLIPETSIELLNSDILSQPGFTDRFTLVNTKISRTAKNAARDVASLMNENIPSSLFTLNYLKTCAADAARAVATRDLQQLAQVINECRMANNRLHTSLLNSKLESLFEILKPHYVAVKTAGTGGGGFALFLSESPESANCLRKAIAAMGDSGPRTVDFSLNNKGLTINVL